MEGIRLPKKRRYSQENDEIVTEKLFLDALRFQDDLVNFCGKILTEVLTIMLDVDNKGKEINMYLHRSANANVPVKKRSTNQEPCGWLHHSKREELHKKCKELRENISGCNVKLENLKSSVESLNKNMCFLKTFFGIAENREKTDMSHDDLIHFEGKHDTAYQTSIPPAKGNSLVNEAVACILADLSEKVNMFEKDLNTLTNTTVTAESLVRTTMTAIRKNVNDNSTDPHRQTSNTSATMGYTELAHSTRCMTADDTKEAVKFVKDISISSAQPDFVNVTNKEVTITIKRSRRNMNTDQKSPASETETTNNLGEPKTITIDRETYDKMKRNSSTAFARKLLPFFFNKSELESCNFNTLQDRDKEKMDTLLEVVGKEFPYSTTGFEAMKKMRDGINSSCRAYREKSRPSSQGQQSVTV